MCNPDWPEVKRFLKDTNLTSEDMPGILCRTFKTKLDSMIKLFKDKYLLGKPFTQLSFKNVVCLMSIFSYSLIQRINSQSITYRSVYFRVPAVTRLPFHLPGQQIIYGPEEDIEDVLTKTSSSASMFTGWMEANKDYENERKLSYAEFPTQDACYRRGILDDDDKECIEAIEEASLILSDEQLKNLALLEIEEFLVSNNSSLRRYTHMPFPDQDSISTSLNPLIMEELAYDTDSLRNDFKHLIASLLLECGRTAHSRFLIPINMTEDSRCQVKTDVSDLLKKTSIIIWDEAPMIHKHAFQVLDRTLKDVMKGDFVVVLGGDFRQILLVVHNRIRNDCVNAIVSSSYIWSKCKVLKLTKNIRLTIGSHMSNSLEIKQFADWLLDIGEERFNDLTYFQEWALLAPLNEVVQEINDRILAYFLGEEMECLSSDNINEIKSVSDDFDPMLYFPDFLNGIKMSGMQNHRLLLKIGVPIMLLRILIGKKVCAMELDYKLLVWVNASSKQRSFLVLISDIVL
ncbi:uncharacterized protein LOC143612316 [Bidens hawaiensis]|uniref:uncharacterized protein LOC143612316 n=1 Tax=Bidens hawaiensis TaxID=980011 RepID=UPI004049D6FC